MELDESCSEVVDWQSHKRSDSSCQKKGKRVNETIFPEPGEKAFFEVIVWPSECQVIEDVSENIDFQSVPSFTRCFELVNGLKNAFRVVSSPLEFGLSIKDLSDRDDCEGVGDYCTDGTCKGSNERFFSVGKVVIWFYRFEVVVNDGVDGVSDCEVG